MFVQVSKDEISWLPTCIPISLETDWVKVQWKDEVKVSLPEKASHLQVLTLLKSLLSGMWETRAEKTLHSLLGWYLDFQAIHRVNSGAFLLFEHIFLMVLMKESSQRFLQNRKNCDCNWILTWDGRCLNTWRNCIAHCFSSTPFPEMTEGIKSQNKSRPGNCKLFLIFKTSKTPYSLYLCHISF